MKFHRVVLVVAFSGVAAAGCSNSTGSAPTGQPSSGNENGSPVPKITKPIDMTQWEKKPCAMVDQSTVASIGKFKRPEQDTTSRDAKEMDGPSCSWESSGMSLALVQLTIGTVAQREAAVKGIAGIAKQNGDRYHPFPVDGHPDYPAATVDNPGAQDSSCDAFIGVRDDLDVGVTVDSGGNASDHAKSCSNAKIVVKDILDNIAPK